MIAKFKADNYDFEFEGESCKSEGCEERPTVLVMSRLYTNKPIRIAWFACAAHVPEAERTAQHVHSMLTSG